MAYKLNMGAGPGTGVEASPAIIELAGGQRPPQLGHRRSGGTHRRDVNDHLSSATGGAASLIVETSTTTYNEHGTIYAISSDFGDRMTTQHLD